MKQLQGDMRTHIHTRTPWAEHRRRASKQITRTRTLARLHQIRRSLFTYTLTPSHVRTYECMQLNSCRGCTCSCRRSCSPRRTARRPPRTVPPCSQAPRRGRPRRRPGRRHCPAPSDQGTPSCNGRRQPVGESNQSFITTIGIDA